MCSRTAAINVASSCTAAVQVAKLKRAAAIAALLLTSNTHLISGAAVTGESASEVKDLPDDLPPGEIPGDFPAGGEKEGDLPVGGDALDDLPAPEEPKDDPQSPVSPLLSAGVSTTTTTSKTTITTIKTGPSVEVDDNEENLELGKGEVDIKDVEESEASKSTSKSEGVDWAMPHEAMTVTQRAVPAVTWDRDVEYNSTEATPEGSSGNAAVGVAIGVSIVCLLICAGVVLLVLFLVKRRKTKRKEKSIVKVENPHYQHSLDRRATLDKSLSTAPTVNFQATSNKITLPEGSNGSLQKRKGEAPAAPIYRPSKEGGVVVVAPHPKRDAPERPPPPSEKGKRQAPVAPAAGRSAIATLDTSSSSSDSDIYEKDSPSGSMDQLEQLSPGLSLVANPGALAPPTKQGTPQSSKKTPPMRPSATPTRQTSPPISPNDTLSNSPTEPLLSVSQVPPAKPSRVSPRPITPTPKPRGVSVISDKTASRPTSDITSDKEGAMHDDDDEDPETALLTKMKEKKKSMGSNASLDSYDRTLNPFFADKF